MIMAGMEFMGDIPFSEVYIHGTVRDDAGLKMSKSLGNSIDPLDIINQYSADALRFSLIMLTATGQDVYVSAEKFEIGRNFGTKIWNAARFMQMHTKDLAVDAENVKFDASRLSADDQHILARLHECIAACTENLEKFRFNDYAKALYEFLWHQFCDWYVEYSKQVFYGTDESRKQDVLNVMHHVFSNGLRLLHPLMPFLTEELWHGMGYNKSSETIMRAPWPKSVEVKSMGIDSAVVDYVDARHELIRIARTLKTDSGVAPAQKVDYILKPVSEQSANQIAGDKQTIVALLRSGEFKIDAAFAPAKAMPSALTPLGTVYMSLEGAVDADAEAKKLSAQLAEVDENLKRVAQKLENESFVSKAPAAVVDQQRAKKQELLEKREKLVKLIEALKVT
jgi:valyl-tRNA synthetase